jgi:hypothetical protein
LLSISLFAAPAKVSLAFLALLPICHFVMAYMIVIGTFGAVGNLAILLAFFTAPAKVSSAFLGVPCNLYAFLRN